MTKKINDRLTNSQRYKQNHPEYRERHRVKKQKKNYEKRLELIHLFGDKCVRCGFTDVRALQIDHVNGNGNKERKRFQMDTIRYYNFILSQIQSGSKDYQLLCANCNWIKRYEQKEFRRE